MREAHSEKRESADQVTEGEKFLRSKVAVCKLVAEEHSHNGGHRESVQDEGLLKRREFKTWKIAKDEGKPCSPDEKLQNHHQEELHADCFIHEVIDAFQQAKDTPK